ncbi:MAG TPA: hypothetical protein DDW52_26800 [Planctomycetaceae bacterium]|nr:hypothetical protein [Planctomycetaceae bacterium]
MSQVIDAEKVRGYAAHTLASFGAKGIEQMHESILIRSGLFCGRKYQCDGYHGVWFIEENEIKFFAPCGDLLVCEDITEAISRFDSPPTRRAA